MALSPFPNIFDSIYIFKLALSDKHLWATDFLKKTSQLHVLGGFVFLRVVVGNFDIAQFGTIGKGCNELHS